MLNFLVAYTIIGIVIASASTWLYYKAKDQDHPEMDVQNFTLLIAVWPLALFKYMKGFTEGIEKALKEKNKK